MIYNSRCPVCHSENIEAAFSAKDNTVTGESFVITKCSKCTCMFTQDAPSQEHIGRYYASENYVSHSYTKKGIVNRLYHLVRKITLRSKLKLVQQHTALSKGSILDIGSGAGAFLHEMKHAGWEVSGLEPDETARQNASALFGIDARESGEIYHLQPGSFDAITMWHVLEHVHELHQYIAQIKTVLKPGAVLFVAVPNYTSADAAYYEKDWAAYDVPRHLYHFSPEGMKNLVEQHGMRITQLKPMWFDAYYVAMLSEKYRTGKANNLHAIWRGFLSNRTARRDPSRCSSLIYIIKKTS